jgi:two-component system, NtrC family, sensor histidine kinase HydH
VSPPPEHRAFEHLPLPVAILREGRTLYVNAALEALVGVARGTLLAWTPEQLMEHLLPRERPWLTPMREAEARGEPVPKELWLRVRTAGGEERTFWLRWSPGPREGERTLLMQDAQGEAHARALTEALATAAGELMRCRSEEEVLQAAVDAIHRQGFWVATLRVQGDELVHGPMHQDPAAVAAGEALYGKPISQVRFARASLPHLEELFASGATAFHQDVHRVLESFHSPEVSALLKRSHPSMRALDAPIFVEAVPYGLLALHGDALNPASAATLGLFARQVGSALENVRHHEHAARQLAELRRLQGELVDRERLAVLGEAAAVVAHEVRNPLGAILNAAAVVRRNPSGPHALSAVGMLEEEALRLEAVVRDLLDVVRPLEPRPRTLQLGELARRVLRVFEDRGEATAGQLRFEEEPGLPTLEADQSLLQLALENLVRNALQASPPGSPVEVRLGRCEAGLCLSVEDRGAGLAEADALRVFEPFFTTRATGTGLGLSVVRRVVHAHGGSVRAAPRPGGGARFELVLPLPGAPS